MVLSSAPHTGSARLGRIGQKNAHSQLNRIKPYFSAEGKMSNPEGDRKRILFVEDHEDTREVVRFALEEYKISSIQSNFNADPEPILTHALIKVKLGEFSPSSDRNLAGIEIVIHPESAPRPPNTNKTSYCMERIRSMLAFIILQSSDPERETFLVANLLIFITAF